MTETKISTNPPARTPPQLSRFELAKIAAAAGVDPRTAAKVIAGKPTTSTTRGRVIDALRRRDLLHVLATDAGTGVDPAR